MAAPESEISGLHYWAMVLGRPGQAGSWGYPFEEGNDHDQTPFIGARLDAVSQNPS